MVYSWRISSPSQVCFTCLVLAVIVGEFGSWYRASLSWKTPTRVDGSICILVLADPQILGYFEELSAPLGPIIRWDADMYLRKAFTTAMHHVKPDLIVFLGDLLNEGFSATDQEFAEYKARFDWIFSSTVPRILLAGDNDIGGEGWDNMTPRAVARFVANFGALNDVIKIGSFQFVKLNTVSFIRKPGAKEEMRVLSDTKDFIQRLPSALDGKLPIILLSHATLSRSLRHTARANEQDDQLIPALTNVLVAVKPVVTLSGHVHKASEIHHRLGAPPRVFRECVIPTCSYRMGTDIMGLGVVVVDSTGKATTSILNLPKRYIFLKLYVCLLAITALSLTWCYIRILLKNSLYIVITLNRATGLFS